MIFAYLFVEQESPTKCWEVATGGIIRDNYVTRCIDENQDCDTVDIKHSDLLPKEQAIKAGAAFTVDLGFK